MDPNAAVQWLLIQMPAQHREHTLELIRGLCEWSAKGGFPPVWEHFECLLKAVLPCDPDDPHGTQRR